jgi:Flp pilus assembly protein TadG
MDTLKPSRSSDRGQAVIEMALTLPLLLLVVFGIFDFGFMFQRYEVITNAAREGARLGVLPQYNATEARNRALNYLAAGGVAGTPVAGACDPGRTIAPGSICAQLTEQIVDVVGSTPVKTVQQVTMVVEFDHQHAFVGPIMSLFGGSLGTVRLRAVSIMRRE